MVNYIKNFFEVRYNNVTIFPNDPENIVTRGEKLNTNLYIDGQIRTINDMNVVENLGAVYYTNKYLLGDKYNIAIKDILNKELILYKIRIIEEVANKYKNNCKVIVLDEKGREIFRSSEKIKEHSDNYMVLELQDLLKLKGLYEKDIKDEFITESIVFEAKLLYAENALEFISKTIINNKTLKSRILDYIQKVIFRNKIKDQVVKLMSIEKFIHDKNQKLTREAVISLLLHFNFFLVIRIEYLYILIK